jgi:hypothetical protein
VDENEIEKEITDKLILGELDHIDAKEAARKKLLMKTEIRIQAQTDPIVEETRQYRQMADEVDDRYARYDRIVEGKPLEENSDC